MALDIQPPYFAGTAALAGNTARNLRIDTPGALGLQALQIGQAAAAARQSAANQLAQIQQQGALGLGQQQLAQQQLAQQASQQGVQNQLAQQQQAQQASQFGQTLGMDQAKLAQQGSEFGQNLGMDQAKLAQQGNQFGQTLGIEQSKADTERMTAGTEAQKVALTAALAQSKAVLQDKGAFASYGLIAMNNAKTPEEANQVRTEILKDAVASGHITQADADASAQMPISQFKNGLTHQILIAGQAKEYKDMIDANKAANPAAAGVQLSVGTDANGNPSVNYSSTPAAATTADLQKKVNTEGQMLNTLNDLSGTFRDKYFTQFGKYSKWASEESDKLKDLPVAGGIADSLAQATTGMDKPTREQYINDSTQYLHSAGQMFQSYIQSLAGSRVSQERIDAFEKLFANPSMSPVEYKAGITQLLRDISKEKGLNDNILLKGINITPGAPPGVVANPLFSQYRQDPAYKDWSDEKIQRALHMQGGQ